MSTRFSHSKRHAPTTSHEASRTLKAVLLREGLVLGTILVISAAIATVLFYKSPSSSGITAYHAVFYTNIASPAFPCATHDGRATSHAGFIGLEGDTSEAPKRSFFWYFEAENAPDNAPLILTTGGGPGTSGLMNPVTGQSPCGISPEGPRFNPNRWSEHFNLLALDHPIGVGYSYGTKVNNSRSAALDVYDFLQKFFQLYPELQKNKFVISGGSYGGVYAPNIASVIHEENKAIEKGNGKPGAVHINLESIMLSNPISDPLSYFRWLLHYRCVLHQVYNSTTCHELYKILPVCLESTQLAFEIPTVENRVAAEEVCWKLNTADAHDTVLEDIRRKCHQEEEDSLICHPQFAWMNDFFTDVATKRALGVPEHVNFTSLSLDVNKEFRAAGDLVQQHQLLFEPLLRDGIRLLHYIGAQDANCAWPGVLSTLRLLKNPFQQAFIEAKDLPWPSATVANTTVRSVGKGAGNFTYILIPEAGHMVVHDQPALVKSIVEHWVQNQPFLL
ncbi:Alpha/Beta hydrolase protein [Gautieria morchelliformis]|nr:Alpha/Beta hydrolase protein [Gautieria morchelliformis]